MWGMHGIGGPTDAVEVITLFEATLDVMGWTAPPPSKLSLWSRLLAPVVDLVPHLTPVLQHGRRRCVHESRQLAERFMQLVARRMRLLLRNPLRKELSARETCEIPFSALCRASRYVSSLLARCWRAASDEVVPWSRGLLRSTSGEPYSGCEIETCAAIPFRIMCYRNEIGDASVGLRSRNLGGDVLPWRLELHFGRERRLCLWRRPTRWQGQREGDAGEGGGGVWRRRREGAGRA